MFAALGNMRMKSIWFQAFNGKTKKKSNATNFFTVPSFAANYTEPSQPDFQTSKNS